MVVNMGLLDTFFGNADKTQALGLLGAGMMNGGFAKGAPMAMQYLSEAPQRQRQGLLQDMQMQEAKQRMQDAEAARTWRSSIDPSAFGAMTPVQQAMFQGARSGAIPMTDVLASLQKDNSPLTVAPGSSLVERGTYKPLFTAPKETELPSAVREYQFAVGQGYKGSFDQWDTARKRAGATNLSVNTDNLGLKPKERFEMEDKLRNDYVKATGDDQAIMTTAADIKNILAQPGSLKDQAAIYKFAKALDPQGAVREADYAAIVKTAGGLEYLQNLANKALTGEQLSPGQRKQMADVTAAMARVAEQRIGRQQKTYGSRAKMYNLTPENVFSTEASKGDGWAIVPPGSR
jgi:hypothetical protein